MILFSPFNLYNSAKICHEAFKGENKIMVHSITRKSGQGLPSCGLQEELKHAKDTEKVRGRTKAAVLTGDLDCLNLVAFSMHDTKPVHFLSMTCTSLKWVEKVKWVYNKMRQKCWDEISMMWDKWWLQQWYEWHWYCQSVMRNISYWSIDEGTKMVVGNMDVGCTISSCKCIHTLWNNSPYNVEERHKVHHVTLWLLASDWHGFSAMKVLLLTTNLWRSENFKTAWPVIAPPPLPRLGQSMIALLILTLECFKDGLMMTCTIPFLCWIPNVLAAVYANGSRKSGSRRTGWT